MTAPDALPPAAVEAGVKAAVATRWRWAENFIRRGKLLGRQDERDQEAVEAILTAALPHLRAQWEGEIKAAFREGYDTGSDPAWCEKQLRRARVKAEPWEPAATDYFWQESEAAAALRAPTAPSGEAP